PTCLPAPGGRTPVGVAPAASPPCLPRAREDDACDTGHPGATSCPRIAGDGRLPRAYHASSGTTPVDCVSGCAVRSSRGSTQWCTPTSRTSSSDRTGEGGDTPG